MGPLPLAHCIAESLKNEEMCSSFEQALLHEDKQSVRRREESEYWDYKEGFDLQDNSNVARLAKYILGFHNSKGGAIIVGITNDYRAVGIHASMALDRNKLRQKLAKYLGTNVYLFQDSLLLPTGRVIWVIFIKKRSGLPTAALASGPKGSDGLSEIKKNTYYVRMHDEVRPCIEPIDFEYLFSGVSFSHMQAYAYEVDEPYYRLLSPHCEKFIGRTGLLKRVHEALQGRHPVIALDGAGGVGKSALAIEVMRQCYDSGDYLFIISLSAKSRVWQGRISSRRAGFSGLSEFLIELANVLGISIQGDTGKLKKDILDAISGNKGLLLVDNIEDVVDGQLLHFIGFEVPDPVKVLVTSRIDRGLGALTISVEAMENDEASDLLQNELIRLGYQGSITSYVSGELFKLTGRLPLAIKWVAALAGQSGSSLAQVEQVLKTSNPQRQEFLNFCFASMYNELSALAKKVALLCPYLGEEWNTPMLSLALEQPESEIEKAIFELQDRGIVLASGVKMDTGLRLLPLTVDYLAEQFRRDIEFRKKVTERLADIIVDGKIESYLSKWNVTDRTDLILQRVEQLRLQKHFDRAIRLARIALQWSPNNPRILFITGRLQYESGAFEEGLGRMRCALSSDNDIERKLRSKDAPKHGGSDRLPHRLTADDRVYLGSAIIDHGAQSEHRDAISLIAKSITEAKYYNLQAVADACIYAIQEKEYKDLELLLQKIDNIPYMEKIMLSIRSYFSDPQLIYACGHSIARGLRLIIPKQYEELLIQFKQDLLSIETMLSKQKADTV